jgi:hypothetical protein
MADTTSSRRSIPAATPNSVDAIEKNATVLLSFCAGRSIDLQPGHRITVGQRAFIFPEIANISANCRT